jgi:hypothetical protein
MLTVGLLGMTPATTTDGFVSMGEVRKLMPVGSMDGEKIYRVCFNNVRCDEVLTEIEQVSELMLLNDDAPDVRVSIRLDNPVTLNQLFGELNRVLEMHDCGIVAKPQAFYLGRGEVTSHGGGYRDVIEIADLPLRPQRWHYAMMLSVKPGGQERAEQLIAEGVGQSLSVWPLRSEVLVRGRVMDLQKFVDGMGEDVKK